MSHESTVLSLLGGVEFEDPRMYTLLEILIKEFYTLDRQINPPVTQSFLVSGVQIGSIDSTSSFTATIYGNNVRLSWSAITGTSYYDVRYKSGVATASDWSTANSILRTTSLSADINPLTIPLTIGSHTFLIKPVNSSGIEATTAAVVVITIIQALAPTISSTVIDNNVLLTWTAPTSQFDIAYYNVYKNGVKSGTMKGTFEAIFETSSGTYTYGVEAIDIVGNIGVRGFATLAVRQPPDFELFDSQISDLSGTKVNVVKIEDYLLCSVNATDTWDDHFSNMTWADIQDQIDAGFPIYAQPSELTGDYEEIIDYGTLLTNVIVSLRWSEVTISGSVAVVAKIASSEDDITYTAFTTGTSVFYASLRYVKIRFEFTATNTTGLLELSDINTLLDVKREVDSGQVNALASDGLAGTLVNFNKTFRDIDSIELTVAARQPITAIYLFTDVPNPTSFNVLAYDSSGNQVDYLVSWMARGIV